LEIYVIPALARDDDEDFDPALLEMNWWMLNYTST
jgi:hypothetical protein